MHHHLDEVVHSRVFLGSKRIQDFLKLIVGHALERDFESLRERMIGAEMFGRPVDYDTGSDAVVRVKANELRKKLAQYYAETSGDLPVRIQLPSGTYVPRFVFNTPEPPESASTSPADAALPGHEEQSAPAARDLTEESPASGAKPLGSSPGLSRRSARKLWLMVLCACILLASLAAIGLKHWYGVSPARQPIKSIAILPLKNLLGDPKEEYFADGMTEELINALGQVSDLRVISLTSSMSYKGTQKRLPEIARELGVEGVVEGGVLRDGDNVRISVQLFDAKADRPIWSESYLRHLSNNVEWQGEVAQAIGGEILAEITPQEQVRFTRRRLVDPGALDLYLQGVYQTNAHNCSGALGFLEQAIQRAPDYAEAYAALASCYQRMGESGWMPYKQAFSLQEQNAVRAIELDESLAAGHAELSNAVIHMDWDWARAEREIRRAVEINPNSADLHQRYAFFLLQSGHPGEVAAEIQRGISLDPVSQDAFRSEGFNYYYSRQYDQALAVIDTVRTLHIAPPDWSFLLGCVYLEKGKYTESIAEFLKGRSNTHTLGHLGNAYARAGNTNEARKIIEELKEAVRKNGVGSYEIALVYAGLGDKQQAFAWLDESYTAHDVGLAFLRIDPTLDPLRSDPRFNRLLQRVGLAK